jgi:hypothetical protein
LIAGKTMLATQLSGNGDLGIEVLYRDRGVDVALRGELHHRGGTRPP